jgi:hypothetical protein
VRDLNVPKSVKGKLDPSVAQTIDTGKSPHKVGGSYVENLVLSDSDFKERTRKILWEVYQNEGYSKFMSVVQNLKNLKNHEFNSLIQVKGETAEVVLEIILTQFIKEYDLGWSLVKGLILNIDGPSGSSSSTAETDLILLTPAVVSIFEIKSYNGNKVLFGDCTLRSDNSGYVVEKDAFSQNRLHIKAFWNNFKKFALSEVGIIKSVLFSFARGSLNDNRSIDKKEIMPVYDETSVSSYLEAIRLLKVGDRWDINGLSKAVEAAQENAISLDAHIANIVSRHGGQS